MRKDSIMAKNIYCIKIDRMEKKSFSSLNGVKKQFESLGWKTNYFRKEGERFLLLENPFDGARYIYSYCSKMEIKII